MKKNKINKTYEEKTYYYGKLWIWAAVLVVLAVPAIICIHYNAWPPLSAVLKGLLAVAPIFWTVGLIEVITYSPMLGTGGTFLAFVTGNVTAAKVPAALNAMEAMDVKPGTEEADVISTIAIAVCSIVTTLIIAIGVFLFTPLTPILNSPVLQPAFDNILPALFGGLAVVFIGEHWQIGIPPLILMLCLFIAFPSLSSAVGILVPVGALFTILIARILYKKGKI